MNEAKKAEKVEKFELICAEIGGDEPAKKGKKAKKAKSAKAKRGKKDDSDDSLEGFIVDDDDAPKKKAKTVKKR